jgi:hypothetical protein
LLSLECNQSISQLTIFRIAFSNSRISNSPSSFNNDLKKVREDKTETEGSDVKETERMEVVTLKVMMLKGRTSRDNSEDKRDGKGEWTKEIFIIQLSATCLNSL